MWQKVRGWAIAVWRWLPPWVHLPFWVVLQVVWFVPFGSAKRRDRWATIAMHLAWTALAGGAVALWTGRHQEGKLLLVLGIITAWLSSALTKEA